MDPDPTPDPTLFFKDFMNVKNKNKFPHIYFLWLTHLKIIFFDKILS